MLLLPLILYSFFLSIIHILGPSFSFIFLLIFGPSMILLIVLLSKSSLPLFYVISCVCPYFLVFLQSIYLLEGSYPFLFKDFLFNFYFLYIFHFVVFLISLFNLYSIVKIMIFNFLLY